jgi:phosphoesterase RecJ-like protein
VTSDTFKIISKLTEVAPDFHKAIFNMENSNTPDSIAFIGKALSSIDIHCGGILAISSIEYSFIKDKGLNVEDLSSDYIPNQLKSVIGWDVAVFLIESKEGFVKVSMRTRNPDKYDLSVIALALGGGGHKAAAGALIKGSIEEAKKMVVTEVEKMLK